MSDLPQISHVLPGFSFSSTKSTWAEVKGFRDNVELEVAKDVGQETVTYVSNIYKYYVAYKLAAQQAQVRQNAKRTAGV